MRRLNRVLLCSLLVLTSLLATAPARAGYYSVSYSGGSDFVVLDTPNPSGPYTMLSTGGYGFVANAAFVNATWSGTITATFNWLATRAYDPPPASVIITENCTSSGIGYPNPTITVDDGLGDPQINATAPKPREAIGTSSGIRYSVKMNPGMSFTVTCSPSGNVVAGGWLDASLVYTAAATPVTVNLVGATYFDPDAMPNVLIGQKLTVSLNTGTFNPTTWSWQFTGDPFVGFTLDPLHIPPQSGHATLLTPADRMMSNVTYAYRSIAGPGGNAPIASTITCTATIPYPNKPNNPPLQVVGVAVINVFAPTHTEDVSVGQVGIGLDPNTRLAVALATAGNLYNRGITWNGSVTQPSNTTFPLGTWFYAQTVTPRRDEVMNGQDIQGPFWGQQGLDNQYPYVGAFFRADGSMSVQNGMPLPGCSDSPRKKINPGDTMVSINDTYQTFMLYTPPDANNGVTATPLHEIDWQINARIILGANGRWGLDPTSPNTITKTLDISTTNMPDWMRVIGNM